jgi:putative membrane protein
MDYEYKSHEGDMILRDYLAYDRTKFALLRTFLSIERTALGLLASGAALVILQTSATLVSIGYVLVVVAFAVFVAGGVYAARAKRRLDGLKDSPAMRD